MDINTTAHAVFEDLESSKYICSDRKRVACVWKYVFYRIYQTLLFQKINEHVIFLLVKHADVGFTCWFPRTTQRRTIFVSLFLLFDRECFVTLHEADTVQARLHAFHYTDEDQTEILYQPCRACTTLSHATFILNAGIYLFFIIYSLSCWS